MSNFLRRIVRAARLDETVYQEVEADPGAMGQAMRVVVLSGLAAGVGSIGWGGLSGILRGTVYALVGWYIWAVLTYVIGAKVLPEVQTKADLRQLLGTIGFSSSPGILRILGLVPGLGAFFVFLASAWMLMAMIVAVKVALDYSGIWRAVAVCVIGWVIQMALILLLMLLFGGLSATA